MLKIKSHDRYIIYDVAAAFDFILDETNHRALRAVRLYEVQVAILLGTKLLPTQQRGRDHSGSWVRVSRETIVTARLFSRLKLLDHILKESSIVKPQIAAEALLLNQGAKSILDEIINPIGLRSVGRSLTWRNFDIRIRKRRRQQKTFAPLYDVSIRYALGSNKKAKCTWTKATKLLTYNQNEHLYGIVRKHYKSLKSHDTAYKYKDIKNYLAGFIWLDHFGGSFFRPNRPDASSFATKLLAKADDTAAIRNYLGQYEAVYARLKACRYSVLKLRLSTPIAPTEVALERLPEEIEALI